jgi:hypothetical protein
MRWRKIKHVKYASRSAVTKTAKSRQLSKCNPTDFIAKTADAANKKKKTDTSKMILSE